MGKPSNTDVSGMTSWQIAKELERLVFTASHDWRRSIRIDRDARDTIVHALREQGLPTIAATLGNMES